jgi:pimeloyl-ACP methyl ester carboxylesterase
MPGSNGATIIMPPPFTGGRDSRLREADLLLRHGYTIFTFESRRCAGMGPVSLGYQEVDEVADALDYLLRRPEVDPDRIGLHGFSSAGATAVMAAARLPALGAVVVEGGYGDFAEDTLTPNREYSLATFFEILHFGSIKLTYRLVTGVDIDKLSPQDVINQIAPRPILLIYGSREVSLLGGRHQQAAAGDNAILWIVPGAGHGNYLDVAPEEYEARLVDFFDAALQ